MKPLARGGLLLLSLPALVLPLAFAQTQGTRNIQGKVLGSDDQPLSGAIVYLENSKTNDIKSYITEKDGTYLFGYTSMDTDYTIWARYKGVKGDVKSISSFNDRKEIFLDLHVKTN
jgi:hypothetical protein